MCSSIDERDAAAATGRLDELGVRRGGETRHDWDPIRRSVPLGGRGPREGPVLEETRVTVAGWFR